MGFPQVTQQKAGRIRVHTSSVDSVKRYVANITHDGENGQCQEPLSELKTLRTRLLFLIQAFVSFPSASLLPAFCKISSLYMNMNDYWFFSDDIV